MALGNETVRPDGSVMVSVVVGCSEAGYFIGYIDTPIGLVFAYKS
jgi:hypothetical protein